MKHITADEIYYLFDEIWPEMMYSSTHRDHCLSIIDQINKVFDRHPGNLDRLLNVLDALDGIGLTIASGLIWRVYPDIAIPFDKYTMTYTLDLEWIMTNEISTAGRYTKACLQIHEQLALISDEEGEEYSVEDFLREAGTEMSDYPALIDPM